MTGVGTGKAGRCVLAAALMLAAAGGTAAQDRREYDPKIEKWAAARVSARLGELRGSFAPEARVEAETVHDAYAQPPERPKRLSPIFVLPQRGEQLPPIVMGDGTVRPPGA